MRKADADTFRAEAEGGRERGEQAADGLIGRPKQRRAQSSLRPFLPSASLTRSPGGDVSQKGANELQQLSLTSPAPAAIG